MGSTDMRQIKFRAWDKREKNWTVAEMGNTTTSPEEAAKNHFPTTSPVVFNGHGECEIMQFTGLLDKNGKEIWEDDVVSQVINGQEVKAQVVYYKNGFYVKDGLYSLFDEEKVIVLGNIYENPELIKPV